MHYDYIVIGAGIAGASAAYELAQYGSVLLLEAESAPGYHSTGRSAALYTPHFGFGVVRQICRASYEFLAAPDPDFCTTKLLSPRGLLTVAKPGEENHIGKLLAQASSVDEIVTLSAEQALEMAPLLRPELVGAAAFEKGVMDIEVATLHQSYLTGFKKRGGTLRCNARVEAITHIEGKWSLAAKSNIFVGQVIVNAAGAWVDEIAKLVGAEPIGIIAKRRTAIIINAPNQLEVSTLPAIDFASTDAYIKPDAGKLMASPGDQTPVEPQDIQPEEMDIAILADWLESRTTIEIRRIEHSWAGLRSFVKDHAPVVGFDEKIDDFFWLAGQGGYGIMMSPALARATAALIRSDSLPDDFVPLGITREAIAPNRCANFVELGISTD